ncbi:MAG: hypothetical protein QG671_1101 [Actinomycetota bacterium]|nr:hypothetical protein [Actinomycetota bacterium]
MDNPSASTGRVAKAAALVGAGALGATMLSGVGYPAAAASQVASTTENLDGSPDAGDEARRGGRAVGPSQRARYDTRSVSGDVTSVTATTVTIQAPDGFSQTFVVDSATSIRRNGDPVGIADVRVGDKARITGIVAAGAVIAKRIGTLTPEEATMKQAERAQKIRKRLSGSKSTRLSSPAR